MKAIFILSLAIGCLILHNSVYAQVLTELETCNVLYLGHKTKFDIGFVGQKRDITINCINATVQKEGDSYFITPEKKNEVVLEVVDNKTKKILRTKKFEAIESPKISLYIENGDLFSRINSACFQRNDLYVTDWICKYNNVKFFGKGYHLTDSVLKLYSSGKQIQIEANILSLNGEKFHVLEELNTYNKALNFSGYVSFIDKNEKTKHIFDKNDPLSLISLIEKNIINTETLDSIIYKRIKSSNPTTLFSETEYRRRDNDGYPIIKKDSLRNEILLMFNGVLEPVLEEPCKIRLDFDDITRLVICEDSIKDEITGRSKLEITKLGFAKKYPKSEKYDVVFMVPFEQIRKLDAFKAFIKLDSNDVSRLLNDTASFYYKWNFLNRGKANSLPKLKRNDDSLRLYSEKFNYLDVSYLSFFNGRYNQNYFHDGYNNYINEFKLLFDYPKFFKSLSDDEIYTSNLESEKYEYQPVDEAGYPLSIVDPMTGEQMYVVDSLTGVQLPLVQGKQKAISYIYNDKPTFYLQYDFMHNDSLDKGNNNAYIESIIVTKNTPELNGELITHKFDLYKKANDKGRYGVNLNFDPIVDKYVIKNYTSTLPCFQELNKQIKKRKRLDVNNSKDVKKIMQTFNLDHISDLPINLLGILPIY